ncbi:MAG: methyl-CpG-binding protein, partial [Gemmatimonadetes bacterium]|nr:methyl-CpG-binding protein [Gemmatimonadota bacterium]
MRARWRSARSTLRRGRIRGRGRGRRRGIGRRGLGGGAGSR